MNIKSFEEFLFEMKRGPEGYQGNGWQTGLFGGEVDTHKSMHIIGRNVTHAADDIINSLKSQDKKLASTFERLMDKNPAYFFEILSIVYQVVTGDLISKTSKNITTPEELEEEIHDAANELTEYIKDAIGKTDYLQIENRYKKIIYYILENFDFSNTGKGISLEDIQIILDGFTWYNTSKIAQMDKESMRVATRAYHIKTNWKDLRNTQKEQNKWFDPCIFFGRKGENRDIKYYIDNFSIEELQAMIKSRNEAGRALIDKRRLPKSLKNIQKYSNEWKKREKTSPWYKHYRKKEALRSTNAKRGYKIKPRFNPMIVSKALKDSGLRNPPMT
jgi:hypothetical protein